MNKLFFSFISIILLINAYTSTDKSVCELKKINENSTTIPNVILNESDCIGLKTSNDTIYKCSLSLNKTSCFEDEKSDCEKKTKTETSRRMLSSSELTENECKQLKTSNDTEYICTVNSDK